MERERFRLLGGGKGISISIFIISVIVTTNTTTTNNNNNNNSNNDNNNSIIIKGHREAVVLPKAVLCQSSMANLPTKILDFRGFDPSIISIIRGAILWSIGNFPEC